MTDRLARDCTKLSSRMAMRARSLLPALRRFFWLLMVVGHAPALLSACRACVAGGFDLERLGVGIALSFSMFFFALKLVDARCVRFQRDRRSLVAFCLIVALLHVDAIRRNSDLTLVPECTALVATTWAIGTLPFVRRSLREAFARAVSAFKCRSRITPTTGMAWLDVFRPHCWILAYRYFGLRAPPA